MSTATSMGMMPRLLPITGSFVFPFALLNLGLNVACIRARTTTNVSLGRSTSATSDPNTDPLTQATSAHSNFTENVPLALIFAALIELNGGNKKTLTYALVVFLLARVSHAVGLLGGYKTFIFRKIGFLTTAPSMLAFAGWASYLTKGYWGF